MKTIELILPDENEDAGIEAVAFVDLPAIEINFHHFNKDKSKDIPDNLKVALKKLVNILGRPQSEIFSKIIKRKPIEGFQNEGWTEHIEYKFMKKLFNMEDVEQMDKILKPYMKTGENIFSFYVSTPWVQLKYRKSPDGHIEIIATNKIKPEHNEKFIKETKTFRFISEEKRIVVSPLMIPDKIIPRIDDKTNEPYNCFFSKETIGRLSEKYMNDLKLNSSNIMHDPNEPTKITMLESWIVCDNPLMDKSSFYGFNVPAGTWMTIMKVKDDETWNLIKSGELKGLSIEGNFGEVER